MLSNDPKQQATILRELAERVEREEVFVTDFQQIPLEAKVNMTSIADFPFPDRQEYLTISKGFLCTLKFRLAESIEQP